MRELSHNSVLVVVALGFMLLPGCMHTELLSREDIQSRNDQEILVKTTDGREILFTSGNYTVTKIDSQYVLRGEGKRFIDAKRSDAELFQGEIPISSLSQIEARDRRYYILAPIVGACLIGVYLWLHSMSWG